MNATVANRPWAPQALPRRDAGWRLGRRHGAGEGAGEAAGWMWELRRNCSISPRQLLAAYLMLCALAGAIGLGFWLQGVEAVLVFTGLELVAVGIAMLVMARHAGDREVITLADREMAVEQHVGPLVECTRFHADWVRVEPSAGEGSLVELSGEGRSVRIGRHLRPEWRDELAQELRRALRQARVAGGRDWDQTTQA